MKRHLIILAVLSLTACGGGGGGGGATPSPAPSPAPTPQPDPPKTVTKDFEVKLTGIEAARDVDQREISVSVSGLTVSGLSYTTTE